MKKHKHTLKDRQPFYAEHQGLQTQANTLTVITTHTLTHMNPKQREGAPPSEFSPARFVFRAGAHPLAHSAKMKSSRRSSDPSKKVQLPPWI